MQLHIKNSGSHMHLQSCEVIREIAEISWIIVNAINP